MQIRLEKAIARAQFSEDRARDALKELIHKQRDVSRSHSWGETPYSITHSPEYGTGSRTRAQVWNDPIENERVLLSKIDFQEGNYLRNV
jgi:hypothetical protein